MQRHFQAVSTNSAGFKFLLTHTCFGCMHVSLTLFLLWKRGIALPLPLEQPRSRNTLSAASRPIMFKRSSKQDAREAMATGVVVAVDKSAGASEKRVTQRALVVEITRFAKDSPLGMALVNVHGTGVIVSEVEAGSAVANAGLMPGDTIVSVGSAFVTTTAELKDQLKKIAGTVEFGVYRSSSLPKGWKSSVDQKSGRTIFYKGKDTSGVWSYQHPRAVQPLRDLPPQCS